ncbi:hypothetical protein BC938DRAFT_476664 [Jimgerdemannia flammicorona]|uniref:Uncharacterized protein n=1 Tax=Jimgerdemannia flammicorona TaxID=994334 RepID=A0A433QQA3_9FUNG|nr:hypothetical protein BC938DRAFT_476664 [Jimgerdemannia flammicorona]
MVAAAEAATAAAAAVAVAAAVTAAAVAAGASCRNTWANVLWRGLWLGWSFKATLVCFESMDRNCDADVTWHDRHVATISYASSTQPHHSHVLMNTSRGAPTSLGKSTSHRNSGCKQNAAVSF